MNRTLKTLLLAAILCLSTPHEKTMAVQGNTNPPPAMVEDNPMFISGENITKEQGKEMENINKSDNMPPPTTGTCHEKGRNDDSVNVM